MFLLMTTFILKEFHIVLTCFPVKNGFLYRLAPVLNIIFHQSVIIILVASLTLMSSELDWLQVYDMTH